MSERKVNEEARGERQELIKSSEVYRTDQEMKWLKLDVERETLTT